METATDRIEAKVELTRASILAAAEARFSEYGYTKTTLVEVAQAADMSAANLYRFFENKLDIAAALALRAAVADAAGSAAQRLEDFVLAALRFDRDLEAGSRHLPKLLDRVIEERKEVAVAHRKARQEMLEQLVAEGMASGEFAECDASQAAKRPSPQPSDRTTSHSTKPASGQVAGYPRKRGEGAVTSKGKKA